MKNLIANSKRSILQLAVKVQNTLRNDKGVEIVEFIIMVAVVCVVIGIIFFPQLKTMVTGSMDGGNKMLSDIWGTKG